MKHLMQIASSLVLFGFLIQGCKKATTSSNESKDQVLIHSAKTFFEAILQNASATPNGNNRSKAAKQAYWAAAYCAASSNGPVVVAPVVYQKDLVIRTTFSGNRLLSLNSLTKLVISKDSAGFHAQVVTYFPDSTVTTLNSNKFSGVIFTESYFSN